MLLNLRVVEIEDVDELTVVLLDALQLVEIVPIGVDAEVVKFLNNGAYV